MLQATNAFVSLFKISVLWEPLIKFIIFLCVMAAAEEQLCGHILPVFSNTNTQYTILGLRQLTMKYQKTLINQNLSSLYSDKVS